MNTNRTNFELPRDPLAGGPQRLLPQSAQRTLRKSSHFYMNGIYSQRSLRSQRLIAFYLGLLHTEWASNIFQRHPSPHAVVFWKHAFVTFLACPKKGDAKEEGPPATILVRHARSSSGHFGNSPFRLRHPKCFSLGLGRLTGMVAWGRQKLCFPQAPRVPGSGPTEIIGAPHISPLTPAPLPRGERE